MLLKLLKKIIDKFIILQYTETNLISQTDEAEIKAVHALYREFGELRAK